MRSFVSSVAVNVQASDEYVTTGLVIVLYIFISLLVYCNVFFSSYNYITINKIIQSQEKLF